MPDYSFTFKFSADSDAHAAALSRAAEDAVNMIVLNGEDLSKSAERRFTFDHLARADYNVPMWRKVPPG